MKDSKILWLLKIENEYTVIVNDEYKELNIIENEIIELANTYSDTLKKMNIKSDTGLIEKLVTLSVEKMLGKISNTSMIKQVKDILKKVA